MRLLIATRNDHKVQEIRSILGSGFEFASLVEFSDAPDVSEDADSFEGNARKKAIEISLWLRERHSATSKQSPVVLADDSGLEVDALDGAPGVRSARFAGKHGDTTANNRKLLDLLKGIPPAKRRARFRCVIAVAFPANDSREPVVRTAAGACEGRIIESPRGTHGFGYDPLFVPDGYTQTFAEMGSDVKDRISHRARALANAREILIDYKTNPSFASAKSIDRHG